MNTIILLKGETSISRSYCKDFEKGIFTNFQKGDTILGENTDPEEIKRWSIKDRDLAKHELEKYRCTYERKSELWKIQEFALEYCTCDEEGSFISGSDYELADEE